MIFLPSLLAGTGPEEADARVVASSERIDARRVAVTPIRDGAPSRIDAGIGIAASADAAVESPKRTRLVVRTEPEGAEIELDGVVIGKTPFAGDVVADGGNHKLRLRRPGYTTEAARVRLLPDGESVIERNLERAVKYGTIDIYADPWANVYFRGRKVGVTPQRGLRLPVGRHKLKLVNPVKKREKSVVVDVPRAQPYQFTLD